MVFWLEVAAATLFDIAGIVSLVRFLKSRNKGQLFLALVFFTASSLFYVAAFMNWQQPQP